MIRQNGQIMYRFKCVVFCFFLQAFSAVSLFGQDCGNDRFYTLCNDTVFFNGDAYQCDKSPISCIKGYYNIYPNTITLLGIGVGDKDYILNWAIIDSALFLCDIPYIRYRDAKQYDNNRHIAIEKLTKKTFKKPAFHVPKYLEYRINPHGMLFAEWFSCVLYIHLYKGNDCLTDDEGSSFLRLTFQKGKITKIEKVTKM